ncbi:MAG: SdrD B-like domain-containing protein, partial [Anaerolineae bacterium]
PTATSTPTATPLPSPTGTATATPAVGGIRGVVWNDLDGDGERQAGEPGLPGATVILKDMGFQMVDSIITGSSGQYQFTGLAPADYVLSAVFPPGFQATTVESWIVAVMANWTVTIDFGAWAPQTATPTATRTSTPGATPPVRCLIPLLWKD